ncbi:MAG: helix-turn-helix domain-containing protein [Actinomycetota bacterium]|nr:helix-turn-helix domain-containing protein [Actinomycetota bacterium]
MSAYATTATPIRSNASPVHVSSLLDGFINELADRVAERLAQQAATAAPAREEWLDSRHAAEYLGVHRDTLRKLAAERSIPCEQDGPGCKLYFRRSDLDAWRHGGGRPRHLALVA